jgi:cell division protein FtsW (lipid II flippase)
MVTVTPRQVRPGRGVELALLVLALALGTGGYALAGLGATGKLPPQLFVHSLALCAFAGLMHVVLRIRAPYADQVMLPIAVALNGVGLAMIYRLDVANAARGHATAFATRQLGWTAVGVVFAALVLHLLRDHRTLRRLTYTAMVASLVLLVLPLIPGLGEQINGASIWIRIGTFSVQPAEFAKITLAMFFAGYLVTNRDTLTLAGKRVLGLQLPRVRDLGPLVVAWAVSLAVLVFQGDLGTSLLFFGLFVAMLYLATERTSWIVIGMVMFAAGAAVAATSIPHVAARFDGWLHAFDSVVFNKAFGGSGQLARGLFGMASGGLFGTGWGLGRPDLVPFAESDFIVASLGEELGLTGLIALLVAYLVLAERGLRTAVGVRDGFGKLLAGGLAFVVALQCFVVVGGVTRVIPLTGLTMPFMAYGGSSLLANWVIVALLLRISDNARRPAPAALSPAPGAAPATPSVPTDDNATEVISLGARSAPADHSPPEPGARNPGGHA